MQDNYSKEEPVNIQYSKVETNADGVKLLVNGHINNTYYESTLIVSPNVMEEKPIFERILKECLQKAKLEADKLKQNLS